MAKLKFCLSSSSSTVQDGEREGGREREREREREGERQKERERERGRRERGREREREGGKEGGGERKRRRGGSERESENFLRLVCTTAILESHKIWSARNTAPPRLLLSLSNTQFEVHTTLRGSQQ